MTFVLQNIAVYHKL